MLNGLLTSGLPGTTLGDRLGLTSRSAKKTSMDKKQNRSTRIIKSLNLFGHQPHSQDHPKFYVMIFENSLA